MVYIYALRKGSKVIYVGRSINVENRIKSHSEKKFDSYEILARCTVEKSRKLEDAYIKMFNPECNRQLNEYGWYININDFSRGEEHKRLLLKSLERQCSKPLFAENFRGCDLHMAQQYLYEVR